GNGSWGSISIEGYGPEGGQGMIQADGRIASAGYFETMGIPLVGGRFFSEQDTAESMKVAIIDENMARTYFAGADPVGKRFKRGSLDSGAPWYTIVGVVGNVKQYALDTDSRVAYYTPQPQSTPSTLYVAV